MIARTHCNEPWNNRRRTHPVDRQNEFVTLNVRLNDIVRLIFIFIQNLVFRRKKNIVSFFFLISIFSRIKFEICLFGEKEQTYVKLNRTKYAINWTVLGSPRDTPGVYYDVYSCRGDVWKNKNILFKHAARP